MFGTVVIHRAPKSAEVRNFTRTSLRVYVSLIGERKSVHENFIKNAKGGSRCLGRGRYRWKVNVKSRKIVLG
jgi:hypothetical protein